MEREILFRGLTRKRGEKVRMDGTPYPSNWVYGGIFAPNVDGDRAIIYDYDDCKKYPIYADTVGQFTGLTDKNGTRIFEGDIIRHFNSSSDRTAFEVGVVYWSSDEAAFRRSRGIPGADPVLLHKTCYYEVIGNIHDNPELVGGDNL